MIAQMAAAFLVAVMIADGGATGPKAEIYPDDRPVVIMPEEVLEVVSKPEPMHLYGNCVITFYDNGPCCCGPWAGGHTASGTVPRANHTVAHNTLPFGTRLLIDGIEYVVEDRGDGNMDAFWVDIYVDTHEEANRRGMYRSDVYIIDG